MQRVQCGDDDGLGDCLKINYGAIANRDEAELLCRNDASGLANVQDMRNVLLSEHRSTLGRGELTQGNSLGDPEDAVCQARLQSMWVIPRMFHVCMMNYYNN